MLAINPLLNNVTKMKLTTIDQKLFHSAWELAVKWTLAEKISNELQVCIEKEHLIKLLKFKITGRRREPFQKQGKTHMSAFLSLQAMSIEKKKTDA